MAVALKNNLKLKRFQKQNMTQAQLAELVDVSRQTIIAIEQGKFNPSVKLALLISGVFDCNVEEVFYLEKKEENK
jgi:putative transcriptional regulator